MSKTIKKFCFIDISLNCFEFYVATIILMNELKLKEVEHLNKLKIFKKVVLNLKYGKYNNYCSRDLNLKEMSSETKNEMFEKIFNELYFTITSNCFEQPVCFSKTIFFYFLENYNSFDNKFEICHLGIDQFRINELKSSLVQNNFKFNFSNKHFLINDKKNCCCIS